MSIIEDLEREVSQEVDGMTADVIIALMDKWEKDIVRAIALNEATIPQLLNHYVRLKISWGRLKRFLERDYNGSMYKLYDEKEQYYTHLIKEARRNYYVTKRRYENEHAPDCSCRGCRCVKGITGSGQVQSQVSSC